MKSTELGNHFSLDLSLAPGIDLPIIPILEQEMAD